MTIQRRPTSPERHTRAAAPAGRRATARPLFAVCAAFLLLAAAHVPGASAATRQTARPLRLPPGRSVTVRGTLRPGTSRARVEYSFRASAGQKISVRLTSNRVRYAGGESAGAVFFVLDGEERQPPDFGDYPYGGPTEWTGRLPAAGTYRIRVLVEDGPDDPSPETLRRLNQTVRYTLRVTFPRR